MKLISGVRRLTVFLLVGAVCFLLGVALPFMICRIARTSSITGPSLEPEGLRPRPLPLKADHSLSQLQNVLNNLLITVKTTHSYHYPRVVILLETWVSLVRSQVSKIISLSFSLKKHIIRDIEIIRDILDGVKKVSHN